MAQGLKLPLEAADGRLVKLSGDEYIEQLVRTAFLSGDSDNPFQDGGFSEKMIFQINDSTTDGEIRQMAKAIFASLEQDQLAKIATGQNAIRIVTEGEERHLEVTYVNMETGGRVELEVPLPGGE